MFSHNRTHSAIRFLKVWVFVSFFGANLTAQADDLEAYAAADNAAGHNILFLLDTSRSMTNLLATVYGDQEVIDNSSFRPARLDRFCTDPNNDGKIFSDSNSRIYQCKSNLREMLPSGDFDSYCYQLTSREKRDPDHRPDPDQFPIFIDSNSDVIYECKTRLRVMKEAIASILDSLEGAPVNIGLQRFNSHPFNPDSAHGGTIVNAVGSILENRRAFELALEELEPQDLSISTPLQESLWESYRYYAGLSKVSGDNSSTDPDALTGTTYNSPIAESCQSNNVVLLSDGLPTYDDLYKADIEALLSSGETCDRPRGSNHGACLNELAGYMNRADMAPDVADTNTVQTYTIGFTTDADADLLEETAEDGGGQYFTADDAQELRRAFQDIAFDILANSTTFVAPTVSVNAFNQLQHRNEVYYAVFKPTGTPRWPGNVKKYALDSDGNLNDANGDAAIDVATGFFKNTAQSFWSNGIDGATVTLGGAAEQLTATRKVYTLNDADQLILIGSANFSQISLNNVGSQALQTKILEWLIGIDTFDDDGDNDLTEPNKFIADPIHSRPFVVTYGGSAAQPEDVLFFTTNLGTLHAVDPSNGTELWSYLFHDHKDNLRDYVEAPYTSTHTYGMDGELTVVTTEGSSGLAAVQLYLGERRGGSRFYGLDASNARINTIPSLRPDTSYGTPFKPLWKITGAVKDGSSLGTTAQDVTSSTAASPGFRDMGQSWSRMIPTKLTHANGEKEVLIFSGGYDPRHDDISHQGSVDDPDYGNAIYIVDALTGGLIYSIGNNNDAIAGSSRAQDTHNLNLNMFSSIPATPTVIDIDGDGDVDTIFVIDVIGYVWRIDFNQGKTLIGTGNNAYATGGLIAKLASADGTATVDPVRRFYNSVDVSRSNASSGSDHLNIVVGSGYRASPHVTEELNNRLYILFDKFPVSRTLERDDEDDRYAYFEDETVTITAGAPIPNERFRTVTAADLGESSFDDSDATTDDDVKSIFNSPNGIFINFESGEKVLQRSTTFNGVVVVSTFNPNGGQSSGGCGGGNAGSARTYVLDINTGLSVLKKFDNNGQLVEENGEAVIADFYALQHQGIPAETATFLLPSLTVCIGAECNIDAIEEAMLNGLEMAMGTAYRTFWREEQ